MSCPCGSSLDFTACCEPILSGMSPAPTAEALMRARYTAFTRADIAFLMASVHPDSRHEHDEDAVRDWAENSTWKGLEIRDTVDGGEGDDTGSVEFVARYVYQDEDRTRRHHELATFARHEGQWLFVNGEKVKSKPVVRDEPKVGRNDPCPCGSGKKYKKCCGQA